MNSLLFNCCTKNAAPDWSRFSGLTVVAMADYDGRSEVAEPGQDVDFWCIFGIDHDGMFEPITDCTTLWTADACMARLAEISNLPQIV